MNEGRTSPKYLFLLRFWWAWLDSVTGVTHGLTNNQSNNSGSQTNFTKWPQDFANQKYSGNTKGLYERFKVFSVHLLFSCPSMVCLYYTLHNNVHKLQQITISFQLFRPWLSDQRRDDQEHKTWHEKHILLGKYRYIIVSYVSCKFILCTLQWRRPQIILKSAEK